MSAERFGSENQYRRSREHDRTTTRPSDLRQRLVTQRFHARAGLTRSRYSRAPAPSSLHELAAQHGIVPTYTDASGRRRQAPQETLKRLLACFGVETGTSRQIDAALRENEARKWRQVLPPVIVAWDNMPCHVLVRIPETEDYELRYFRLRFEDGACKSIDWEPHRLPVREAAQIEARTYVARRFGLPAMPFGYHSLELELKGRLHRTLVVSAPSTSYSPAHPERNWGLFAPMYALTSRTSWGAGNLGEFRRLADWAIELGAGVVATLPLLSAFLDVPACEASPYSPVSRLFWNEFYLDIEAVPEFSASDSARQIFESASFQQSLRDFRQSPTVDYRREMRSRRQVLEAMSIHLLSSDSARRRNFEKFVQTHSRAQDYAAFRATCEQARVCWRRWEERMKRGKLQPGDFAEADRDYHLYVQWLAAEQMADLAHHCRDQAVRLHLDLPLGAHPAGYDLWREGDSFAEAVNAGAPPDPVFTAGQDWGFAPLHPARIRERGYAYVLEFLRFQMRHASLLRIDHVPGLHRLFWIPHGFPPAQGAYVSYAADEFQAILCLESHRHRTILAGENLGTVPPEVNHSMRRRGLRETYVVEYEQRASPVRPLRSPPRLALASLNTHDMPPFAGHCRGLDIEDRADLGLVSRRDLAACQRQRKALCFALTKYLTRQRRLPQQPVDEQQVAWACLEWLAVSPAETVLINTEDLWGETEPQNVPGTSAERPNWQRKFRLDLESITNSAEIRDFLQRVNAKRKKNTGRQRATRQSPGKIAVARTVRDR